MDMDIGLKFWSTEPFMSLSGPKKCYIFAKCRSVPYFPNFILKQETSLRKVGVTVIKIQYFLACNGRPRKLSLIKSLPGLKLWVDKKEKSIKTSRGNIKKRKKNYLGYIKT